MGYTAKNWVKAAEEIRAMFGISLSGNKDNLPQPEILRRPFFEDPRMEFAVREMGKENLAEIYLEKLNAPLREAGVYPLFGSEMIKFSTQVGGMVYFDGVTEVLEVGDDLRMAVMPFSDFRSDWLAFKGRFAPLMYTREAFERSGALGVAIVPLDTPLPHAGQIRGRIRLEKETLDWLNSELMQRNRITLPERLTEDGENARKITKEEIKIFDQNSNFYTIVNIGGQTLRFSRINAEKSEGEVFLVRTSDTEIIIAEQLRPLMGVREKGVIRGFPKKSRKDIEFNDEVDANLRKNELVEIGKMISSRLYDYTHPDLYFVRVQKGFKWGEHEAKLVVNEIGFESLYPLEVTERQMWDQIAAGNIWEVFTITALTKLWLSEKSIRISESAHNMGIILEHRAWAGGDEGLTVPYIHINAGVKISEVVPDSGTSRIIHPVNLIKPGELPTGHKYEIVPVAEFLNRIITGEFDTSTISAVMTALIQRGGVELTGQS
jgi:hypothetical protein